MPLTVVQYKCSNSSSVLSKNRGDNGISETLGVSMPQKFRNEDGGASFASGRMGYIKAAQYSGDILGDAQFCKGQKAVRADMQITKYIALEEGKWSRSNIVIPGRRRNAEYTSSKCCYNGKQSIVTSSEEYINRKKRIAIGRGTISQTPFAFKDNDVCSATGTQHPNHLAVADAKRRCRNGGYVVPPKCRGGGCGQPQGWRVTSLLGGTACHGWNTK